MIKYLYIEWKYNAQLIQGHIILYNKNYERKNTAKKIIILKQIRL